ncbi:MAG: hypothetical protein E7379_03145 [Clostridiales bacterium]|nr:hypothetical protein [Clostridiales bacterium]
MKNLMALNLNRVHIDGYSETNESKQTSGAFKFDINGDKYFVIASVGCGWQHVSVSSYSGGIPSWDIMETIKKKFFESEERVVEFHPKKADYVNNKENCLHMWIPLEDKIPYPDLNEFKKNKPQLLCKKVIQIDGVIYSYTHSKNEEFEQVEVKSGFNKRPTWNAMCKIKQEVFGDEVAVSFHGEKGDSLTKFNDKNTDSILLWKPVKQEIKTPPSILVGFKDVSSEEIENALSY